MGRIRKFVAGSTFANLGLPVVNFRSPTEKNTRELKRLREDQQRQHGELLDALQRLSVPTNQDDETDIANSLSESAFVTDEEAIAMARDLVVRTRIASTAMIQRKLQVGYARAERIMKSLEELGVVGPENRKKQRDVLLTVEDLESN